MVLVLVTDRGWMSKMKWACHTLETMAMEIFVSHGWMCTTPSIAHSDHKELEQMCNHYLQSDSASFPHSGIAPE